MKRICICLCALLSIIIAQAATQRHTNSFDKPDFAYPQTVISDAQSKLKSGSDIDKLRAAIQITIAANDVTPSEAGQRAAMLDSLAHKLPTPYSELALLLEARLYTSIYLANSWKYNNRQLLMSDWPADPMEWSGQMFRHRITELAQSASSNINALNNIDISKIASLLEPQMSQYQDTYPTVGAFITSQVVYLLNQISQSNTTIIPFENNGNTSPSALATSLIDNQIDNALSNQLIPQAVEFTLMRSDYVTNSSDWLLTQYKNHYRDYPEGIRILLQAAPARDNNPEIYELLKESAHKFEGSKDAASADYMLCRMSQGYVDITCNNQYLSTDSISVTVSSSNTNTAYLLLYAIEQDDQRPEVKKVLSKGKLISATPVVIDGVIPFQKSVTACIPNPGYGRYAIIASTTDSASGISNIDQSTANTFVVSDLLISFTQTGNENRVYVTDGHNFAPVADAKLAFSNRHNKNVKTISLITNSEGYVSQPEDSWEVTATRGNDRSDIQYSSYSGQWGSSNNPLKATILTDLPVYHPGDTICFSSILYSVEERRAHPAKDIAVKAILKSANYQGVDTLSLTTDIYGRINSQFTIPKDGMLGNWSIVILNGHDELSHKYFSVAEYKLPTFYVDLNDVSGNDSIVISGKAVSWTGMPLANAKVVYTIDYSPLWYLRQSMPGTYTGITETDASGSFSAILSTDALKNTPFERGGFTVVANVTDAAGETQSSPTKRFALGNGYHIDDSSLPERVEVKADEICISIPVADMVGKNVSREVDYVITNEKTGTTHSGTFLSPLLIIPAKDIPSGQYKLTLTLQGDTTQYVHDVIIYRADDKNAPYATPLWIPQHEITASSPTGKVKIPYATGFTDSPILCQVSNCNGFISQEWLHPLGTKMSYLTVNVPASNDRVWVRFTGGRNLSIASEVVIISPSCVRDSLSINTVSFRDKITPGSDEQWRFAIKYNGNPAPHLPVMAVLSDKALNSIVPFKWNMNMLGYIDYRSKISISTQRLYTNHYTAYFDRCNNYVETEYVVPSWNLYGEELYPGFYRPMMFKSRSMATGSVTYMAENLTADYAAPADMMMESAAVSNDAGAADDSTPSLDVNNVVMSENEHPLAFFCPTLVSDDNGDVEISFTVPQFNTTWQLQIGAYDNNMLSALRIFDVVSSKPVMVKGNYPRFLRTGDKAQVSATLMNNTDSAQPIAGVIEFVDPATGNVLQRSEFASEECAPGASRTVTANYDVGDTYQLIAIKCYAIGTSHSDGEQDLIAILPSSTPVTESTTFYLGTTQNTISLRLPKFDASANVSLQYCANPVWYCVTALPDITEPKSSSLFAKLDALFGNATALGVANRFPQIHTALDYWKATADSMLVSNLSKNTDLYATPWVNNAAAETMRMQRLINIFETSSANATIAALAQELSNLQKEDGGWSWTPEMKSSSFVTAQVLLNIAWLKEMAVLPADIDWNTMTDRAVAYCDKAFYDSYIRNKKTLGLTESLNYLYIRKFYNVTPASKGISECLSAALAKVEKDWRKLDIYGKATAVLLLRSEGKNVLADAILESLRQNAVTTPASGMYYDNIGSGWNGYSRLQTTTQVLLAFAASNPEAPEVDQLRQWLILQRQVQDWGYSGHTAAVVHAILTTGSNWLDASSEAVITLNDTPLNAPRDRYTGAFTLYLDPADASERTLTVTRTGTQPAWGGVIQQYVAPIKDVKAAAVDQLSITKQIVPLQSLEKGAKVRVTLTVRNDRDLQYIEITDDRGACLEPVDQLSSYTVSDGVWIYRETRDTRTNLFIDFLPKGVHQISYECWVDRDGSYTTGIATARSLYTPLVTAHSAGETIIVK